MRVLIGLLGILFFWAGSASAWCSGGQMLQPEQTLDEIRAERMRLENCLVYWSPACQKTHEARDLRVEARLIDGLAAGEDVGCVYAYDSSYGPSQHMRSIRDAINDYEATVKRFMRSPPPAVETPWCVDGVVPRPWSALKEIGEDIRMFRKCADHWSGSCQRVYDQGLVSIKIMARLADDQNSSCLDADEGELPLSARIVQHALDDWFEALDAFQFAAP